MYLEIYYYDPLNHSAMEHIQEEIRDFNNGFPQFKIVKAETITTSEKVIIHLWYTDQS